jgi:hypothetical protein
VHKCLGNQINRRQDSKRIKRGAMNHIKKALIITDKKWRSGEKWFAFKLAKALRNNGWAVHFITAKEGFPRTSAIEGNYPLWETLDPRSENPLTLVCH